MHKPSDWRGYGLALLAATSFSFGVVFSKLGLNLSDKDFYSLAIWGWGSAMVLATLCFYLPVSKARKNLVPELQNHAPFFGLITVLTLINGGSWFYGMSQINGGVVALIDQNVLVWSFLLGALFLGERFSWRQLSAIAITLVGLGIVSSLEGEVTALGVLALLLCGLSISLQSLCIKRYAKKFDALSLTFWRGWGLVVGSWLLWVSLGKFAWHVEPAVLFWLALAQFFGLFIGRAAYIKAHQYLPMSQLSFLLLGVPVLALIGSYFVLEEPLGPQKLLGAGLMLIGLAWFISRKAKRGQTDYLER